MRQGTPGFEREDALACADVLGGFGVSSTHVRERVADAATVDAVDDLEAAIQRALADPEHPTAFVRRTVAAAPRGVDSPARFWTTAPETQLGDVFAAIDWTFDVKSANGRSLSVDDAEPYRLRVEDADGRTRSTEFSFPDTPLGDDNYPALVATINRELLFGLDCRFVQLSDGTDRWRFALVESEELERLVDRFGDRIAAFDRPLLATDQPAAYVPGLDDADPDGAGIGVDGAGAGSDAVSRDDGGVPVPAWARESRERSWRGRRVTADAFDADHVGGLDHLADDGDRGDAATESADAAAGGGDAGGSDADAADAAAAIEFVDAPDTGSTDDATSTRDESSGVDVPEAERGGSTVVRDAETGGVPGAGTASDGTDDDLDGWSVGGSVDATTRSSTPVDDGDSSGDLSTSGFTWGDDDTTEDATATDDPLSASPDASGSGNGDGTGSGDTIGSEEADAADSGDGFFSADAASSFDAGAETSRVEGDSFGVDAGEQTEDDRFAAVGAAIAAPAGISCRGLLDDDEFLPEIPRAEPAETRLTFEDEFDPTADPADERETDDGFVWVNESSGLGEDRTSASD
ncbi:hypothetical protein [Halorubellus sp. PRR65]|uniref:hypothetical protein n=1 Tax=Halorubellus sp. PRR65 TaxID=3098148 RepID=UPI002B261AE8|nr:hypothetical protein [Halorubellus sp. PRR65]